MTDSDSPAVVRFLSTVTGRVVGSALIAASTSVGLVALAARGFVPATWVIRPFGYLGFVFGNVHQGSAAISYGALGGVLFLVAFAALTVFAVLARHRVRQQAPAP